MCAVRASIAGPLVTPRYPFPATPDGWYAIARGEEIAREPRALRFFARDLTAGRDATGAALVRDRERALPSCEANGFVHAWWHASSAPPSYQVARLREDEVAWTPWRTSAHVVRVHVQDMTENILDRAHFTSVHDMALPDREQFDVRFEGVQLVVDQVMKVTAALADGDGPVAEYRRWFAQFYSTWRGDSAQEAH